MEIDVIVEMLEKIRNRNKKQFELTSEDKLQEDKEFQKLYQAYWGCDAQLENVLDLLKVIVSK